MLIQLFLSQDFKCALCHTKALKSNGKVFSNTWSDTELGYFHMYEMGIDKENKRPMNISKLNLLDLKIGLIVSWSIFGADR